MPLPTRSTQRVPGPPQELSGSQEGHATSAAPSPLMVKVLSRRTRLRHFWLVSGGGSVPLEACVRFSRGH